MAHLFKSMISEMRARKALRDFRLKSMGHPDDIRIKIRIGDLQQKLGRKEEAIQTYREVAVDFARKGLMHQAMAMQKLIFRLDATQTGMQEELDNIYFQRNMSLHTFNLSSNLS